MKKLFFIAGLIACAAFASCQKTDCRQCTTTTTVTVKSNGVPVKKVSSAQAVVCDMTRSEFKEYQKRGSVETSTGSVVVDCGL